MCIYMYIYIINNIYIYTAFPYCIFHIGYSLSAIPCIAIRYLFPIVAIFVAVGSQHHVAPHGP